MFSTRSIDLLPLSPCQTNPASARRRRMRLPKPCRSNSASTAGGASMTPIPRMARITAARLVRHLERSRLRADEASARSSANDRRTYASTPSHGLRLPRAAWRVQSVPTCNLYAVTKGQQAIRELTRAMLDRTGNLPPLPGIFPNYAAPIVRNTVDGRELAMTRLGCPRRCSR
jgi:hypothetical protein